jgi:hypothetical protein
MAGELRWQTAGSSHGWRGVGPGSVLDPRIRYEYIRLEHQLMEYSLERSQRAVRHELGRGGTHGDAI